MSSQNKRKASEERYIYSWYLPVPGGEKPENHQGAGEPIDDQQGESVESSTQSVPTTLRSSTQSFPTAATAPARRGGAMRGRLTISRSILKLLGVAGWSAVAGVGLIALFVTQPSVSANSIVALCGVWAGLCALIWFVPDMLMK